MDFQLETVIQLATAVVGLLGLGWGIKFKQKKQVAHRVKIINKQEKVTITRI